MTNRPARIAEKRARRAQLRADYRDRCEREAAAARAQVDRERREREERWAAERRRVQERWWIEERRRAENLRRLQEERAILVERRAAIEAGLSVEDYRALQAERQRLVSLLAHRARVLRAEMEREKPVVVRPRRPGHALLLLGLLAAMMPPGDR